MSGFEGLKAFCDDLASPEPAPGGGTAAAASGAIAASLLSMVCGVTLKSKKHEMNWPRLELLKERADELGALLIKHAEMDALSYLTVVRHARAKREAPGDEEAAAAYEEAVRGAIEVPTSTAEACVEVLRLADEVAAVGTKSASSDIEVARLLAAAGVDGAVANIMVNLPSCADASASARARESAERINSEKGALLAR
ncbi:MAG: cyclodeaminase/cyclohydrolase family protein [Thermoplasmata archaeon]